MYVHKCVSKCLRMHICICTMMRVCERKKERERDGTSKVLRVQMRGMMLQADDEEGKDENGQSRRRRRRRMAKNHGGEEGGSKRRLPDTATARVRPGKVEEYRGYTRRYGRPRGGVNAIKKASIRPSRRTSLISQSLSSPLVSHLPLLLSSRAPLILLFVRPLDPEVRGQTGTYVKSYYEISVNTGVRDLRAYSRIRVEKIPITLGIRKATYLICKWRCYFFNRTT